MPTDQDPIPVEALPPGWGPAGDGTTRIAYRCSRPRIELCAVPAEGSKTHPSLGVARCWELRYEYDIGELTANGRICHVSTRCAAVEALLECMERLRSVAADAANGPVALEAALADADFRDVVSDDRRRREASSPRDDGNESLGSLR